jgi:hypothetical protein
VPRVEQHKYTAGDVNVLTSETFHRVDLIDGEAWSLFVTGPKFSSWGFWETDGVYTPWRQFIDRVRDAARRAASQAS